MATPPLLLQRGFLPLQSPKRHSRQWVPSKIAVADPRADHRVALDAHEVRGGRTLHQKFIQVKNIRRKSVSF